jgi:hypothetical protein
MNAFIKKIMLIFSNLLRRRKMIVGYDVTDRAGTANGGVTKICQGGAVCSADGIITSVEVWAQADMTGLIIGMFKKVGSQYAASSTQTINIGNVAAGKQTFNGLNLKCFAGDYLGYYFNNDTGRIENNVPGSGGSVVNITPGGNLCGDTTPYTYVGGSSIQSIGAFGISGMVMPF